VLHLKTAKEIAGQNVRKYIDSKGFKLNWVMQRTKISKEVLHDLFEGKGQIDKYIGKLSELFRIQDPLYFYKENFEVTDNLNRDNHFDFIRSVDLSYNGVQTPEFKEGIEVLADFINYGEKTPSSSLLSGG
jgi:hypothetical protein